MRHVSLQRCIVIATFYGVQNAVSGRGINPLEKGSASFRAVSPAVGTNDKTINPGELSDRTVSSRRTVIAGST